jgi:LytR cell envelope-related transcriptional attenuator
MAAIPYALSIHHFISSVGADAGFAAIIGLAILVLLFFSQARETSNLRRRADEAEQQLHQLATYVEQMSRTPAPAPAPASAQTTGHPVAAPPAAARLAAARAAGSAVPAAPVPAGAVATIPVAPAGVGAPALSAATRLIPAGAGEISIRSLKNGDSNGAEAPPAAVAAPAGPPPSTAAAGGNGVSLPPSRPPARPPALPPARPPAPPSAATAAAPVPAADPSARVNPRREGAPPAGRPAPPPTFNDPVPRSRRRPGRFAVAVISIVGVVAVIVAVLVVVTAGGGGSTQTSSTAASRSTTNRATRHRSPSAAVAPASVTVAVLNGTATSHLAANVMTKLTTVGYKPAATPTNATSQTVTATVVGYTQPTFRADAASVARTLKLGSTSVQAVSPGDRVKVCPTAACPAQVVVTVGSDLAAAAG